ncbi:MAG TPA: hypothetical protein VK788_02695 [Terriglobales bacterium]|jgi:hypothetical protein|nr:hypothetical protein [Terriglobales bacterium]
MQIKARRQIDEWRNEVGWRIARNCFLPVLVFNCLILSSKDGLANSTDVDIRNVIAAQDRTVREHNPDAKLFQVFVPGLVPDPTASGHGIDVEVHGYFGANGMQGFVEAITSDSKETVEVVKPFEGNDSYHGHPASRSEACLPTVQAPTTDEYLGLDWTLDLQKLAAAFRKNGLDPARPFDVTIVSARRIVSTWKRLDLKTASAVRERLNKENAKEAIVSVTEHSSSGRGGEATWLFRAADYECLGAITFATPRRLPPARKSSTTLPSTQ